MDEKLYADLAAATKYYLIGNEFEERIQKEEENIKELNEHYIDKKQQKTYFRNLIFSYGATGAIFGGAILIICICLIFSGEFDISIILGFTAIVAAIAILSLFVAITFKAARNKAAKECDEEYQTQIIPKINESQNNIDELKKNLAAFKKDNSHILDFLPMTYRNMQAVSFMFLAVSDGRADSLKEAMNLYEEQLHRWKLEEAQGYYNRAINELNSRQALTNAHLQAIEIMQFVNFITN